TTGADGFARLDPAWPAPLAVSVTGAASARPVIAAHGTDLPARPPVPAVTPASGAAASLLLPAGAGLVQLHTLDLDACFPAPPAAGDEPVALLPPLAPLPRWQLRRADRRRHPRARTHRRRLPRDRSPGRRRAHHRLRDHRLPARPAERWPDRHGDRLADADP